ncbi:cell division cycle protein 45 [Brevipalpus obovatus]|uniref:cell division cycle protein 45 n=1 Tax=Brevipalpus obovatus TaxID=246614 RepID=UPI003D9DF86C
MFIKDLRKEFYDVLLEQRVLIMVNHDVDALCSVKLITTLFKYDKIRFTLIPITETDEMVKVFQTYQQSVKYFLLLNCGAQIDIAEVLEPDDHHVIFIADSHRPVDVYNVYRPDQVKLLMDEDDVEDVPDYNDVFREEDEDDEEEDEDAPQRSRSLEELERRHEKRLWEEKRRKVLLSYSEYTYYGESISWLFFKLAWTLSKDSNELLWLTIIGIFDLHINERITRKTFLGYVSQLKSHLKRLSQLKSGENLFNAPNPSIDDILDVPVSRRTFVSITHKKDLKVNLYRHWNLYESFQHTRLLSCKFKVWERTGICRFKEFLADLGLPLSQCRNNFSAMDFDLRKNVLEWVENLSEKYNLDGIVGDSFEAKHGFRHHFAVDDMVYGLNALLESPCRELNLKEKFMKALEALSWSKIEVIMKGIELAQSQLKAILKQVHDLIELKAIETKGPYLYAMISHTQPDARLFRYPGCLYNLARFLLRAFLASSKKKKLMNLPLVLVVREVDDPDSCLAVGIPPAAEDPTRNLFARLFVQTAHDLRVEVLPLLYDFNVVRFRFEQMNQILDRLVTSFSN